MIHCTIFKRKELEKISVKEAENMIFNEELYPCWYVDREFDTRTANGQLKMCGPNDMVVHHLRAKTCQRRRGAKDDKAHDHSPDNIHAELASKRRRH